MYEVVRGAGAEQQVADGGPGGGADAAWAGASLTATASGTEAPSATGRAVGSSAQPPADSPGFHS